MFPAFAHFRRTATDDTELRGCPIKKGDKIALWYPSSNRDEDVYEDPDRFDVRRNPEHQAFGAGGRHEVLEVTGGVLGLFPFARFGVAATRLQPGDLLFSYTDGVNEAKNETGEQFAEQRIRDAAVADWTDAAGFLQQVLERIRACRGSAAQSDDITMLAVRRIFH